MNILLINLQYEKNNLDWDRTRFDNCFPLITYFYNENKLPMYFKKLFKIKK